jgi:Sulfotransferase domain
MVKIPIQKLPTFLILGAQKCGTTSLYSYLSQHPEVYMSVPKETNFFNIHYEQGLEYYWNTFFSGWDDQKAIGESSPPYFFLPYIPHRLAEAIPGVRMVVILRDPVQRAFSHWWMNTNFGLESLSFKNAISFSLTLSLEDAAKAVMCERFYLQAGYYAEQLERYLKFFPRKQFLVIFSEDLKHDPETTLKKIYDFIGITDEAMPEDTVNRFETAGPFAAKLRSFLRSISMDNVIPPKMGSAVRRFLMAAGDKPPTLDDEMRMWLVQHYRPFNRKLQEMLNADLSSWGT